MTPAQVTEFLAAQTEVDRARARVRQTTTRRDRTVVQVAACSLCKAPVGRDCFKPSGGQRGPHAERLREVVLRVVAVSGDKTLLQRTP